ncbi:MAG: D-alanine--D-alanine ligase [Desulfobacteraceae bacterium]|nr:D-alanine--D-alanine ligase [Desulfobacteraceae bacterium]
MKVKNKIRVAVLAGGWSDEREVSLKSGKAVYAALNRERYDVTIYDPRDDLGVLTKRSAEIDLAFILLHGKFGEDGRVQGMLDILQIPFVGSGVLASAMAMNKRIAKDVFRGVGLRVAEEVILKQGERFSVERLIDTLGSSLVIKPVAEGSSIGVSIAHGREEILEGIEKAFQYDGEVMAEEYLDGTEITCCVLGNQALETLPVVEIIPGAAHSFFDYEAKYEPGATDEICPAPIAPALAEEASSCAKKAHRALNCSVWSRSDMIIRDETLYLLETNTIPGMTETSLFPLAARRAGMTLSDLLDRLISLSRE